MSKLYLYLFQKESTESFCPKHVKIRLSMGNVGLVYDYPKKRIKETPTQTLKFEKVSSEFHLQRAGFLGAKTPLN